MAGERATCTGIIWFLVGLLTMSGPQLLGADTPLGTAITSAPVSASTLAPSPISLPGQATVGDLPAPKDPGRGANPFVEESYRPSASSSGGEFRGPDGRFWFRSDYLIYWTKGPRVEPLATSSPPGTPVATAGKLGEADTVVLFGGDRLEAQSHNGFQTTLGGWLDACHVWGVQGDFVDLERNETSFNSGLIAGPFNLLRPFINMDEVGTPEDAFPVAFPPDASPVPFSGALDISVTSYFQSAGLDLRRNLWNENWEAATGRASKLCLNGFRLDGLAGYRLYRLHESLTIHQQSVGLAPAGPPGVFAGDLTDYLDEFRSGNVFHGADLGLVANIYRGPWSFGLTAKAAIGVNRKRLQIAGDSFLYSFTTTPPTFVEFPGAGLLAEPSNDIDRVRTQFAIIPEIGTEIGYQITPHLRTFVGYNILFWEKVVRAPEQVDRRISFINQAPTQVLGPPDVLFRESSFWVQGIRLGAELSF